MFSLEKRVYVCIDLKSFYASVECVERGLDPLVTNLVVADKSRTLKTVCLAVTPPLKEYDIPSRGRLFEVVQKVDEINKLRKINIGNRSFIGKSFDKNELVKNKYLKLDYIIATPRMSKYIEYSAKIYNIYLKYLSFQDIHVYSIDEVFCDITNYLKCYKCSPKELVTKIMKDVYENTSITATAGIGTNLYLAKVAMDIIAKHEKPNEFGVRIAELTELEYRKKLWNHLPLTDFWRIGKGYQNSLKKINILTMGDVARCSILNEELLYNLFGINAEILIDHAWGVESCTMKDIKNYKSKSNSLSSGQVLHIPYKYDKAKLILKEMIDLLVLDLVKRNLLTNLITINISYDRSSGIDNLNDTLKDSYGRIIPKPSHGSKRIQFTSSFKIILKEGVNLFNEIINKNYIVRKITISFHNLIDEDTYNLNKLEQLNLFFDDKLIESEKEEKKLQKVLLSLREKYGKNLVLKGMNLEEGATTIERNNQIGGHKS